MFRWFLATIALTATVVTASADFTISVTPSVGPSPLSPAFGQYVQNAAYALHNGATTNGTVGNPNFWAPSGTAQGGGAINRLNPPLGGGVTGLWNGVVNPTGAFAGQLGNVVYFGLAITLNPGGVGPQTFTPSQVNFNGSNYVDPVSHQPIFPGLIPPNNGAGSLSGASSFGYTDIGGVLTPVATAATPVSNLYYVGFGTSLGDSFPGDYNSPASLATLMTNTPGNTPNGLVTGGYTLFASSGAGGLDVNGAPAPATFALMGLGLAGIVSRFRRR
jgi:hypothetical protein